MGQVAAALTAFSVSPDAGDDDRVERAIAHICGMDWQCLGADEVLQAAMAYWYFSIQFRENLEVACRHHPDDRCLRRLYIEECDTDNLSPWPGITVAGERLDHDEFMRRLLALQPVAEAERIAAAGTRYLERVRAVPELARAKSIASYEDGGLTRVFGAMLRAPLWEGAGIAAFRFFLEQHIAFDSDDGGGHGALSRHLAADASILPLWAAFADLLEIAVPRLAPRQGGGARLKAISI